MDVLGAEARRQAGMHPAEIFEQRPVGGGSTQRGLPRVHMGVHEAGQQDEAVCLDHLRVGGFKMRPNGRDAVAFDQNRTAGKVPQAIIHRHDHGIAKQDSLRGQIALFMVTAA